MGFLPVNTEEVRVPTQEVGAEAVVQNSWRGGGSKENEVSIFEIGSISKTFTTLLLAQMALQHKVTLDEPVRELLQAGTVAKPEGATAWASTFTSA